MAFGTNIRNLQRSWRGTSSRTFFVYPAITIVFEVAIRRRLKIYAPGLLLMLLGYLQYRLCGAYLMKRGQGSGYGAFLLALRSVAGGTATGAGGAPDGGSLYLHT